MKKVYKNPLVEEAAIEANLIICTSPIISVNNDPLGGSDPFEAEAPGRIGSLGPGY